MRRRRRQEPESPSSEDAAEAEAAQERYLSDLSRRVGWQETTAFGEPAAEPEQQAEPDHQAEPEPELQVEAVLEVEPDAEPVVLPETPPRTLGELAELIDRLAPAYPERAEEWRWTLHYLRDFAEPGGRIPSRFDLVLRTAFSALD